MLLSQTRRELRFRKQHAIGPYVADFHCPAAKLVVEIDGATHDARQQLDANRGAYMASLGLKVIRISAPDVLADPEAVAEGVHRSCETAAGPLHHSAGRLSGPPPHQLRWQGGTERS
jgi:very-short-patch-repair endonuclease